MPALLSKRASGANESVKWRAQVHERMYAWMHGCMDAWLDAFLHRSVLPRTMERCPASFVEPFHTPSCSTRCHPKLDHSRLRSAPHIPPRLPSAICPSHRSACHLPTPRAQDPPPLRQHHPPDRGGDGCCPSSPSPADTFELASAC